MQTIRVWYYPQREQGLRKGGGTRTGKGAGGDETVVVNVQRCDGARSRSRSTVYRGLSLPRRRVHAAAETLVCTYVRTSFFLGGGGEGQYIVGNGEAFSPEGVGEYGGRSYLLAR